VDPDTKTAFLELCELCQETLISASETRLIALRTHEALVNARVPGYLEAHESAEGDSRRERLKRDLQTSISRLLNKVRKTH
jgi:hypothetical protein